MTLEEQGRDEALGWFRSHFPGCDILGPELELPNLWYIFIIRKDGQTVHEVAIREAFLGDRLGRIASTFEDCGLLSLMERRGPVRITLPDDCQWLER